LSVGYTDFYHYVDAQPLCAQPFPACFVGSEDVFYITSQNATIQLVFYYGGGYCYSAQQLLPTTETESM
jgi:hypothetical protein